MTATVPAFLDPGGFVPRPPAGALDVTLERNGVVIGRAEDAFTVTSLPAAEGAARDVSDALTQIVENLRSVAFAVRA